MAKLIPADVYDALRAARLPDRKAWATASPERLVGVEMPTLSRASTSTVALNASRAGRPLMLCLLGVMGSVVLGGCFAVRAQLAAISGTLGA